MSAALRTYSIRVEGHLDDHWSTLLAGARISRAGDGTTTITIDGADQSRLHGVLGGVRDIGVVLMEVRAEPPTGAPPVLDHPLRTERLILRPATPEDAIRTWAYRRLESVNEWLTGRPADLDGHRALFTEPDRLAITVIVGLGTRLDAPVIGDLMLRREDAWAQREVVDHARGAQVELGWVLDPGHAGRGYATEAVRELLRFCFDDLEVHRVTASCFLDNTSSARLMERVGMRLEQHAVRDSLHRSGRWHDTLTYAVLRDDWTVSG